MRQRVRPLILLLLPPQPRLRRNRGLRQRPPLHLADVVARTVKDVFKAYCGSAPDMEGKSFTKLLKDIGAIDGKKVTPTDSDLIFAKAVTKGQRRLNFAQFETALQYVADKKGVDVVGIRDLVENSGGPKLAGTTPEAVRFHDDKSTYTGVHQHGGPDSGATGTGTATPVGLRGHGCHTVNIELGFTCPSLK